MEEQHSIESLYSEERRFPPDPDFKQQALVSDSSEYEAAAADPLAWWAERAKELEWSKPWTEVLDWQLPFAKWFVGGKLNISVNCLDRHIDAGGGDKVAFFFE